MSYILIAALFFAVGYLVADERHAQARRTRYLRHLQSFNEAEARMKREAFERGEGEFYQ
jgi:hypothetical protein